LTEHERRLMSLFKFCECENSVCDVCPNVEQGVMKCADINEAVLKAMSDAIEERDALKSDIEYACAKNNTCLICGHFGMDAENKPRCELNNWVCAWTWRGVQKA